MATTRIPIRKSERGDVLNATHARLLQLVIEGTRKLRGIPGSSSAIAIIRKLNERAFEFADLLDGAPTEPSRELSHRIAALCGFLIGEFAERFSEQHPDRRLDFSTVNAKLDELSRLHSVEGYREFARAHAKHSKASNRITQAGPSVRVLFVTAFPDEYWAVLRRIDYYFSATDPTRTRGVSDGGNLAPGWVIGAMIDGRRLAKVGLVCCSRYGPAGASSATSLMVQSFQPEVTVVVGVGASLGDEATLDLGDLGYSKVVEDIHLGKAEENPGLDSSVGISGLPRWDRMDGKLREELEPAFCVSAGMLTLRGVLRSGLVPHVQDLFDQRLDRQAIETLADLSHRKAEVLNLQATALPRPCEDHLVKTASRVAEAGNWIHHVQMRNPFKKDQSPRAVEVAALSGSSVVKQFGMREYLRETFPNRLLLDMEGCGAGQACSDRGQPNPMVIKAACDWATPAKEKSWQPYCADVAAAFAREFALELASRKARERL
ncbi:MAG: hypothetical protein ACHQ9S_20630 [Candidatus Binatia bacterium]